jgi:uncharacterized protein involved in type VI secretion and phage assembly
MSIFQQINDMSQQKKQGGTAQNIRMGLTVAKVTSIQDSDKLGRVKCQMLYADETSGDLGWAYVATPFAGTGGIFFLPNVNDLVLIEFESGDVRHPFVIGSIWGGGQTPPVKIEEKNETYLIQTPLKNIITLSDVEDDNAITIVTPGGEQCVLSDKSSSVKFGDKDGNNSVTVDSKNGTIEIKCTKKITIQAGGVSISLDGEGQNASISGMQNFKVDSVQIDMSATGTASIKAGAEITVQSDGAASVKGAIVKLN